MFGIKKNKPSQQELEAWRKNQEIKRNALTAINEAFTDLESSADYNYLIGLIEMAYIAEILTMNERAQAKTQAAEKYQAAKKK